MSALSQPPTTHGENPARWQTDWVIGPWNEKTGAHGEGVDQSGGRGSEYYCTNCTRVIGCPGIGWLRACERACVSEWLGECVRACDMDDKRQ